MNIYLQHPKHGHKVAISETEAVYDESNGWTRYDPLAPQVEADDASGDNALRVKRKYTRRTQETQ